MELQSSTERVRIGNNLSQCLSLKYSQVTAHVKRIEAVEKDLKALANGSATHEELSRQRAEAKKLYDGLHIGALSLHCFVNSKLTGYDRTAGCEDTSLGSSYVVLLAFTVFITYPDL